MSYILMLARDTNVEKLGSTSLEWHSKLSKIAQSTSV